MQVDACGQRFSQKKTQMSKIKKLKQGEKYGLVEVDQSTLLQLNEGGCTEELAKQLGLIERQQADNQLLGNMQNEDPDAGMVHVESQHSETEEAESGDSLKCQWTRQATLLLIAKRFETTAEFQSPKSKKNAIWTRIAEEMQKNGFYWCTGLACDRKWRNLITTYRRIKNNNKRGGQRKHWEYFDQLDALLRQDKPCFQPGHQLLGSSLDVDVDIDDASVSNVSTVSSDNQSTGKKDGAQQKRKLSQQAPPWFLEYIKDRKEVDRQRYESEKKRLQMEETRWNEMKEIENAKLEAFNKLTDTLKLIFK